MERNDPRIDDLLALPNDIKIYSYRGHGLDICEDTGAPIVRTVPKGCIYVTIEECGVVTYAKEGREESFHSRDLDTKIKLKYPYLSFFDNDLRTLLDVPSSALANIVRVRLPGENYVVSKLYPLSYWVNENGNRSGFATSGFCEKSKMEAHPNTFFPNNTFYNIVHGLIPGFNKEEIIRYFSASVYPTMDEVRDALVDYNPVTPTVNWNNANNVVWEMKSKIEEQCGVFDIPGEKNKDGPNAFLSNTYLMEKFPGIHYNLVCRALDEETCETGKIMRRTMSISENTARRDLLRTKQVQTMIIDKILKNENATTLTPQLRTALEGVKLTLV